MRSKSDPFQILFSGNDSLRINLAEYTGEEKETRCKNVAKDFLNHAVCCGFGSAGTVTVE